MTPPSGSHAAVGSHQGLPHDGFGKVMVRVDGISGVTAPSYPNRLLETLLLGTSHAIVTMTSAGFITGWSAGAVTVLGWPAADMLGQPGTMVFTADDNERGVLALTLSEAKRLGRCTAERLYRRADGSTFWGSSEMIPLADRDGRHPGYVMILSDRSGERAAIGARRGEGQLLGRILASSSDRMSVVALDGSPILTEGEPRAFLGLGLPSCPEPLRPDVLAALEIARSGGTGRYQTSDLREDRHWDVAVTPIPGLDGRPERLLAVCREISGLVRAEQRQGLLMQELAHRVKNTFAMVKAIASQTLVGPSMPSELRDDFNARLLALSHAHDMLIQGDWTSARLKPLVEGIARLHGLKASDRFRITGSDLTLGPSVALSFALVFHELGINAIKYGALSNATGRVTVSWGVEERIDGPRFQLRWEERNGPVVNPPSRKGFGSRLIAHSFPSNGEVVSTLAFEPDGVVFALAAPMAMIQRG